ncbi:hypothetical protein PGT21_001785 [Puccinia graminis f. sp. tritici]|uniref:Uncharacterized protein n=1 Tax=Puccinia graminis f. sp. tritici TaxID=56615 RepID=A0A5B0QVF1_PUCGR|nr:hypothetical protein PGT21_001785 [Puccinia graminis f. sp. tritici]
MYTQPFQEPQSLLEELIAQLTQTMPIKNKATVFLALSFSDLKISPQPLKLQLRDDRLARAVEEGDGTHCLPEVHHDVHLHNPDQQIQSVII